MAEKKDTVIRQEEIILAALTLVANQGVKSMTIERIARIVGIVPSAIYRHFNNKSEILEAVLGMIGERMKKNAIEVNQENDDSLEAIRKLLMRQVQLVMEFSAIPQIMFSEEVYRENQELKAKLQKMIQGLLKGLTAIVERGQRQGRIRTDMESRRIAIMFLGLFQPSAFLYHLSGGKFDIIKQVDITWKMFSRAIQPTNK
ncbi:MAG: TetR family transcriptional regulator [Deltaproteobacteria bacterium]|jgi:AcrR family transcriptional regulator|nr:TetR family transcriptional regulator [Deltaproteobacteria bacterium]